MTEKVAIYAKTEKKEFVTVVNNISLAASPLLSFYQKEVLLFNFAVHIVFCLRRSRGRWGR